jgi:hypothetical protein
VEFRACADGALSFALVQSLLVGFSPEWGELLEDGVEFIAGDASEALKGNGALLKSGDAEHLESVTSRALSRNSSSLPDKSRSGASRAEKFAPVESLI